MVKTPLGAWAYDEAGIGSGPTDAAVVLLHGLLIDRNMEWVEHAGHPTPVEIPRASPTSWFGSSRNGSGASRRSPCRARADLAPGVAAGRAASR
jgi:hypothetical protein